MSEKKNIHAGHRQRMRQRFLETEGIGMEDYQLLEMLLFYSVPRKDTNPLAHQLIERFGSLAGVIQAAPEALMEVQGLSANSAVLVKLIPQLLSRYERALNDPRAIMDTTEKQRAFLKPYFQNRHQERVYMLSIDAKGRLLGCDFLGEGSNCMVSLDIKRLTAAALRHRAACVVLAHSLPGSEALPSQEDIMVTRLCQKALALMGVVLRDHLIFAHDECVSMRKVGLVQ